MTNLVLAESSRDAVLAAVSLARRLPGGADLAFATRDRLDSALKTPAHRDRTPGYRLFVVGPDLASEKIRRALKDDPAERIDWLDANEWAGPGDLCRNWFNAPATHHPFPAIEKAAGVLGLADDPFTTELKRIAEGADTEIARAWRDALDVLADRPLELPASVKPLVDGIPAEIGVLDRGEGEAMRADVDDLIAKSRLFTTATPFGRVLLLVLTAFGRVPMARFLEAAFAKSDADLALVMFDRSDLAVVAGRKHGAEPPAGVHATSDVLTKLPFVARDRLQPGLATLRLEDPPADALTRLVGALS